MAKNTVTSFGEKTPYSLVPLNFDGGDNSYFLDISLLSFIPLNFDGVGHRYFSTAKFWPKSCVRLFL